MIVAINACQSTDSIWDSYRRENKEMAPLVEGLGKSPLNYNPCLSHGSRVDRLVFDSLLGSTVENEAAPPRRRSTPTLFSHICSLTRAASDSPSCWRELYLHWPQLFVCFSVHDKHLQWNPMSFMNDIIFRIVHPPLPAPYPRHSRWCHFHSFVILRIFNPD